MTQKQINVRLSPADIERLAEEARIGDVKPAQLARIAVAHYLHAIAALDGMILRFPPAPPDGQIVRVTLSPRVYQRLKAEAQKRGVAMAAIARVGIVHYLDLLRDLREAGWRMPHLYEEEKR